VKDKTMDTYKFQVERVDHSSAKPFEKLVTAFEEKCPLGEVAALTQLAVRQASKPEIEKAVEGMTGELGFMALVKIDQGPLVSLLGKPKRMTLYYLGNPVIANQMFEIHPEIGLYAPLRALIYEDYSGVAHFTYDRPTSMLQQFQHERTAAVGRLLDDKMAKLAESVVN